MTDQTIPPHINPVKPVKKAPVKPKVTKKTPPQEPKEPKVDKKSGIKVVVPKVTKVKPAPTRPINKEQTNKIDELRLKLKLAIDEIDDLKARLLDSTANYVELECTIEKRKWYQFIAI